MVKVLVVDDEADIRITLKDIIDTLSFEIEEAVDGEDALQKAESFAPAVILLDVMMPGLKTKEILQGLQAKNITCPVILITAMRFSEQEITQLLEETQVVDYIPKPFDVDKILAILGEYK